MAVRHGVRCAPLTEYGQIVASGHRLRWQGPLEVMQQHVGLCAQGGGGGCHNGTFSMLWYLRMCACLFRRKLGGGGLQEVRKGRSGAGTQCCSKRPLLSSDALLIACRMNDA